MTKTMNKQCDCLPLGGWNGTVPKECIIPSNFSIVSWSMNYCSLPVVGNYPEPVAEETEVRYNLISMHIVGIVS